MELLHQLSVKVLVVISLSLAGVAAICTKPCVQLTGVSSGLVDGYFTYCNYKNTTLDERPVFSSGGVNPSLYLYHLPEGIWAIGRDAGARMFKLFVMDNATHPVNISATWHYPDDAKAWEKAAETGIRGRVFLPLEDSIPSPTIKVNCGQDARVVPTLATESPAEEKRITYGVIGGVVALVALVAIVIGVKCFQLKRRIYDDDMDDNLII